MDDLQTLDVQVYQNVGADVTAHNIASSAQRGLPEFQVRKGAREGAVCIVGGGPSLADNLHILAGLQRDLGAKVWAINGAHDWLRDRGIHADGLVMTDARAENTRFVTCPIPGATYYLAHRCHPDVYDALSGADVVRVSIQDENDCGSTSGTLAMCVAFCDGYRDIRLFGFDSSYAGTEGHAYKAPYNDGEPVGEYWAAGRKFIAAPWMAQQVVDFEEIANDIANHGGEVKVYGDGYLPAVAREMGDPASVHKWSADTLGTVFYDLALSPPTFNFIEALLSAEHWRITHGLERVQIKVLPGPRDGFRDDDLPPYGRDERMRWLRNIVLPMAALLPSCGEPAELVDAGYVPSGPHFGRGKQLFGLTTAVHAAKLDLYPLRAPEADVATMRRIYGYRYVTMTLRNPGWWQGRSTDVGEWLEAANEIRAMGYTVVIVPDGAKNTPSGVGVCGYAVDERAATDVLRRAALYGGAALNLGINSGPMELAWFMGVPTLVFARTNEEERASSRVAYEKAGLPPGSQFANARPRQRWTWEPDTAENIVRAFRET